MPGEKKFISDEKSIRSNKMFKREPEEEPEASKNIANDYSSDEHEQTETKMGDRDRLPLEYKMKCIEIAKAHPEWSLQTLQAHGCRYLKRKEYLARWERALNRQDNAFGKYSVIDSWTYDNVVEARKHNIEVSTEQLRQWALAVAEQYPEIDFKASDNWVKGFKQRHQIE